MTALFLFFAGGIAFLICFVTIINNPNQKLRPAPKSPKQLKAEADYIASLAPFPIAGINQRDGISNCIGRSRVRLVADPKNEFNPHAIKVVHESGTHLGFIPDNRTHELRHLLPLYATCEITEEQADTTTHSFRGMVYITKPPTHTNQPDVPNQ